MLEHHKFRNSKCNKNVTDHLPATLVSELSKTSISSEELLLSTDTYDVLADILYTKKLRVVANGQHAEMGPDLSHNLNGSANCPVCHLPLELIDGPNLHSILFHYPCFAWFVYISPFSNNFPLGSQKERENGEEVEVRVGKGGTICWDDIFIMPGLSDGFEKSCFGQGGKIWEVSVF